MHRTLLLIFSASYSFFPTAAISGCEDIGFSAYNKAPVASFYDKYKDITLRLGRNDRSAKLDERLQQAGLPLADKIELLKRLSPPNDSTDESEEIRMERLILSIHPDEIPSLKYSLDYDGDYKDMVEYIFHDIDDKDYQKAIIDHFAKTAVNDQKAVKVLSDVDDTMYANLVDDRYPKKTFYPGVLAFYAALASEPFAHKGTPVTTLSARPNPLGGIGEEGSIKDVMKKSEGRLCPTALSGEVFSSLIGTLETTERVNGSVLKRIQSGHSKEDEIGKVKFANFAAYSLLYPDYHFVFVGDSGQADSITAVSMITDTAVAGTNRVLTTFIHDLSSRSPNKSVNSHSFRSMERQLKVTGESANPKGVIVFRNYIEAATVAYAHGEKLENIITAEELGRVVLAALKEFKEIKFEKSEIGQQLLHDYQEDARKAVALLGVRGEADIKLLLEEIKQELQ